MAHDSLFVFRKVPQNDGIFSTLGALNGRLEPLIAAGSRDSHSRGAHGNAKLQPQHHREIRRENSWILKIAASLSLGVRKRWETRTNQKPRGDESICV